MPIGLFVDAAYAYKCFKGKVDYVKLREYVESNLNDKVDEAYFFNADTDPPKADKMHTFLTMPPPKGPGFRVKTYWLQEKLLYWPTAMGGGQIVHPTTGVPYKQTTQKAVDVGLVFHLTRSYYRRKWSKLVLIAGDSDFHEPVQNLVEGDGVDLYLFGSVQSISQELRPYARQIFELDQEPLKSLLLMPARANFGS
jgi:uncharacterized LabA/DUF88 family protein